MYNLELLKKFVDNIQEQYNEIANSTDEKEINEAVINVLSDARCLSSGAILNLSEKYPGIVEDIEAVIDGVNVELTEDDYEILINKILNFDCSDYNENIAELISELKNIEMEDD